MSVVHEPEATTPEKSSTEVTTGMTPTRTPVEVAASRATAGTRALTALVVLASFYTLYLARAVFIPVVVAILLSFLLSPVVRAFKRIGITEPLGAALIVLGLLGTVAFAAYELADPVEQWIERAPTVLANAGAKIRKLRRPVEQVTRTAEQVERATSVAPTQQRAPQVVVQEQSLSSRFVGTTAAAIAMTVEIVVLLYFLLAVGDLFLQKLIGMLPQFHDKKTAVQIARDAEASVSTYLFTVALINLVEGTVVALALWALGFPNPALWGVVVFVMEFIPYFGAFVTVSAMLLTALTTMDGSVGRVILPPLLYLAIDVLQAYVLTPALLGRRLTLNPVAILIGLMLWWQIWGIPGAFIAVPLLAATKIVCDNIEGLKPVGAFLGD